MPLDKVKLIDAAFLHMETEEMSGHVASAPIFQLPVRRTADQFFGDLKAHVSSRMHLLKTYRVKKLDTPFNIDNPVWVEADEIDPDYHFRRVTLSAPGTMAQYDQACAEIAELKLDLNRPLWQYTLIDGLAGNRVGVMIKIHHAVIDGESGVQQLEVMFDLTPEPRKMEVQAARDAVPVPNSAELLMDAFTRMTRQPFELMQKLPAFSKVARKTAWETFTQLSQGNFDLGSPRTPLNKTVSKKRSFSTLSVSLSEAKAVKKAAGVTLNDVVMAVSAGGLRRFLDRRGVLPEKELTSAIPVSLRRGDSEGNTDMGTLATTMMCGLGTDVADPVERLQAIHLKTIEAKKAVEETKDALIFDLNVFGLPAMVNLGLRAAGALKLADYASPFANVMISNVPGPRQKIYLAGAEMLHYHPVSSIAHGMGLNITVQSYMDTLDFGLIGCKTLIPDIALLRNDMQAAFDELKEALLPKVEVQEDPVQPAERKIRALVKGELQQAA